MSDLTPHFHPASTAAKFVWSDQISQNAQMAALFPLCLPVCRNIEAVANAGRQHILGAVILISDHNRRWLLLTSVGEAAFGSQWQTDLAAALDVTPRTVRKYAAGFPIPEKTWSKLRTIVVDRKALLDRLEKQLIE